MMSGPGIPCGARRLGDDVLGAAPPGRTWLDVCIIGQHLPQMYQDSEMRALMPGDCPALGLCPDCLGFGDALEAEAKALDHAYEESYPGWRSTPDGLSMKLPEAAETVRKLGFPP